MLKVRAQRVVSRVFFLIALVSCCWLACHCRNRRSSTNGASKRWVRWALAAEPKTLDWSSCHDPVCSAQLGLIMEGLTRAEYLNGTREAVPALAVSWRQSSPTEWIFDLRPDSHWSDGSELTAGDFVRAWRRKLMSCRAQPDAALLFPLVNARSFCEGRVSFDSVGAKANGKHKLVLRLTEPEPLLALRLAEPAAWPLPPTGSVSASGTPSLGPYLLEEWSRGKRLKYVPNPGYFRPVRQIAGIEIRIEPDPLVRLKLFLAGETDIVDDVPGTLAPQLVEGPEALPVPTERMVALVFNASRRPFGQLAVSHRWRERFAESIDRNELTRLIPPPQVIAHHASSLADPSAPPPQGSRLALGTLLSELKFGGSDLSFTPEERQRLVAHPITIRVEEGELDGVFANLQAQWLKSLGIKVELAPPGATPTIRLLTMEQSPLEPWEDLQWLADRALETSPRKSSATTGTVTTSVFEHALHEAMDAPDAAASVSSLNQAERWLLEEKRLVVPLYYSSRLMLRSPQLRALKVRPGGQIDLRDVSFD